MHLHLHLRNVSDYTVVYDNTATNTGRHGGVVRLLQERLGDNALLCCPCRR